MIEQIQADISAALKAGDKKTAEALRFLLSSLKYAQIDSKDPLTEDACIAIIKKEQKKRIEARDMFAANNRPDQASQEEFERSLFAKYVPAELTQSQITEIIATIGSQISDPTFALVMPEVMKQLKGKADGRMVSDLVKQYLQEVSGN